MKIIRTMAVLAVLSLVVMAAAEARTIRIDQARIRIEIGPGQTSSGDIILTNPTEEITTVQVYPEDWVYKDTGNGDKSFFPAGTLKNSASKWITYNPVQTTLPPFGQATVHYTITAPPESLDGTYYSILFFETVLGENKNTEGASVMVTGRVGSLVYVDISGTVRREGKITRMDIAPGTGNKPTVFDVEFQNSGNTTVVVEGEFVLFDGSGAVKGRGKLNPVYSREGSTSSQKTEWVGRLEKGGYDAVVTFDLGGGEPIVEEKKIRVE